MREMNLGPVSNPDGSPTELTKQMLADTGRDPVEFAAHAARNRMQDAFKIAIGEMYDLVQTYEPERTIDQIHISKLHDELSPNDWVLTARMDNERTFRYLIYINATTGETETDGI